METQFSPEETRMLVGSNNNRTDETNEIMELENKIRMLTKEEKEAQNKMFEAPAKNGSFNQELWNAQNTISKQLTSAIQDYRKHLQQNESDKRKQAALQTITTMYGLTFVTQLENTIFRLQTQMGLERWREQAKDALKNIEDPIEQIHARIYFVKYLKEKNFKPLYS
jgi:ribosomal protein S15P/S13E